MERGLRDRVIVAVARTATRAFFPSVEVVGTEPTSGGTILAASHLNGFVDPVVMIGRLGFLPRFLAKATLWKNPATKIALGFARVIPVHRAVDGSTDANLAMFADAVAALDAGGTLAVFAEGTTHDDPTIRPLRTGVARIALQAAGSGVEDVRIVPVGITYDDKVALRGRALIHYGEPIVIEADPKLVTADGVADPEQVRALTDVLQTRIESLTPHFESTEEALALGIAAEMHQRGSGSESRTGDRGAPTPPVPMANVAADARRLANAGPDARSALVALVARYRMLCAFVGLDDATVLAGVDLKALTRQVVVLAAIVTVLSPIAVAGLFANLVPLVLVATIGLVPNAPVTKGTVRVLCAAILFPVMWVIWALSDAGSGGFGDLARTVTLPVNALLGPLASDRAGVAAALVVLVAVPVMGLVAVAVISRARALLSAISRWRTFLDRRGQLADVRARRTEVVAATRSLLAGETEPAP